MADILHDLPIHAPAERVYAAFTAPAGLDEWWTARSAGHPELGTEYRLFFEPHYDWRAVVTMANPDRAFELRMAQSDPDWEGTCIGVRLEPQGTATMVRFYHTGWHEANEQFRVSSCCWAMYLRILRRWLEQGERVPYPERLDA